MKYSKGKNPNSRNGFKKGYEPWNKGVSVDTGGHHFEKGHKYWDNPNTKKNLFKKGHKNSEEVRKKISLSCLGTKMSAIAKKRMSLSKLKEKNPNWKGGITPENILIRHSIEYRLWREAVFARDNWTCQKTNIKGGILHAHHIKNFVQYPELRFAIDNGITLSRNAHNEFHKKYGKKDNMKEQLEDFLKV